MYVAGRSNSTDAVFPVAAPGGDSAFWQSSVNLELFAMKLNAAAPIVDAAAPSYGTVIANGATATLAGSTDAGDIEWTSSLDGPLGTGNTISSTLSPGYHLITAAATDSTGGSPLRGYAGTVVIVKPSDTPSDLPKDLKDARRKSQGVTTSQLTITEELNIEDLDIYLDITHPWAEDLDVALISPSGTRVELWSDIGGGRDDFPQLYLDDEAPRSISTLVSVPHTGRFQPEVPGALGGFDGEDAAGTWVLEVRDDDRGGAGVLNDWWLIVDGEAPENRAPTAAGDAYDVTQNESLSVGAPGVLANDSDPDGDVLNAVLVNGPSFGTVTLSPNGSFDYSPNVGYVGLDSFSYQAFDGEFSTAAIVSLNVQAPSQSSTYNSTDTPLALKDGHPKRGSGRTVSELTVSDSGTIQSLEVAVAIDHSRPSDLRAVLTHLASGTSEVLFENPGAIPASLTLSNFGGQAIAGTWRLEIFDDQKNQTGTLTSWSLTTTLNGQATTTAEPGVLDPIVSAEGQLELLTEESVSADEGEVRSTSTPAVETQPSRTGHQRALASVTVWDTDEADEALAQLETLYEDLLNDDSRHSTTLAHDAVFSTATSSGRRSAD